MAERQQRGAKCRKSLNQTQRQRTCCGERKYPRDAERKRHVTGSRSRCSIKQTDREGGGNAQGSKYDVQILEGILVLLVRAAWIPHIQHDDSAGMDEGRDERSDEGEIELRFPLITGVKTGLCKTI